MLIGKRPYEVDCQSVRPSLCSLIIYRCLSVIPDGFLW